MCQFIPGEMTILVRVSTEKESSMKLNEIIIQRLYISLTILIDYFWKYSVIFFLKLLEILILLHMTL